MSAPKGGRLTRRVAAAAVVVAASLGVAGCAAVPDGNSTGTTSTSVKKQIDAAVANAPSQSRIASWYRHVGPEISQVERSVTLAQHAVRRPGHRGLHSACRALLSRIDRVNEASPAPDQVAQHAIAREMADLSAAAEHCIDSELLAAGRSANLAHYWSRIADARILHVLRHAV